MDRTFPRLTALEVLKMLFGILVVLAVIGVLVWIGPAVVQECWDKVLKLLLVVLLVVLMTFIGRRP